MDDAAFVIAIDPSDDPEFADTVRRLIARGGFAGDDALDGIIAVLRLRWPSVHLSRQWSKGPPERVTWEAFRDGKPQLSDPL